MLRYLVNNLKLKFLKFSEFKPKNTSNSNSVCFADAAIGRILAIDCGKYEKCLCGRNAGAKHPQGKLSGGGIDLFITL